MRVEPALIHRNLSGVEEGWSDGESVLSAKTDIRAEVIPVILARSSVALGGRLYDKTWTIKLNMRVTIPIRS